MRQKFAKFPTRKQLRKKSESSQSSQEPSFNNIVPVEACFKCEEVFQSEKDHANGVPMICTFDACPYNHRSIHRRCFEELEARNYHILKHAGRKTANWKEEKIKKCMWKKVGLRILKKFLRCPCDHGYTCIDQDSYDHMKEIVEEELHAEYSDDGEEEAPKIEDIKLSFHDNKAALEKQVFNPFEHRTIIHQQSSIAVAATANQIVTDERNIFKMF